MSEQIDKLNNIYDDLRGLVNGSLHNTLWQIMVNGSLKGVEAAFFRQFAEPGIAIALGNGGYIPANFDTAHEEAIDSLNKEVFGLNPSQANHILIKSMR